MKTPYVDRYGLIRVPLLPGQTAPLWEGLGFTLQPGTGEMVRSVTTPHSDGKRYTPQAWLTSTLKKWELFGGRVGSERYTIEEPETNPALLADAYWTLQDQRWPARDAYDRGWEWHAWAANLCKVYGATGRVKALIRRRAENQWRAWEQEVALLYPRQVVQPAG